MTNEMSQPLADTRCGFVALIGAPNAGKSTLINRLVGSKVSIVSRKVQTTRTLVRGIAIEGNSQIIFVDTPGIFAPKRRLDRAMVTSAWGGAGDADVIALLVDVRKGITEEDEAILAKLPEARAPKVLILNKTDAIDPEELELELIDAGGEEIEVTEDKIFVYGDYTAFGTIAKALEDMNIEVQKSNLQRIPTSPIELTEEQMAEVEKMLDKIEDDDDIQQVFTNIA